MVGAIHHVDLAVSDLERSITFYAFVLSLLGFRRQVEKETPIWVSEHNEIALIPARTPRDHDRYTPGLHHLAFAAASRDDVDAFYERIKERGIPILDPPADYPEYATPYYAVFFSDPDGLKLELVFSPLGQDASKEKP